MKLHTNHNTKTSSQIIIIAILLSSIIWITIFPIGLAASPQIMSSPRSSADTTSEPTAIVERIMREYTVDQYGLVRISDSIQLINNATAPLDNFIVGLRDSEAEHLVYYSAKNPSGGYMSSRILDEKINGYTQLEILFNKPILVGERTNISLSMVLRDMLKQNYNTQQYELTAAINPVLPIPINEIYANVSSIDGSTEATFNPDGLNQGTEDSPVQYRIFLAKDLKPFEDRTTDITFKNTNVKFLKITKLEREISINPLGYIRVDEKFNLLNYGPISVNSFTFSIPGDSKNVSIRDDLGEIKGLTVNDQINDEGYKGATLELTKNRALLAPGDVFYFEMTYWLEFNESHTSKLLQNTVKFDLYPTKMPFLMENITTLIKIIGGGKIYHTTLDTYSLQKSLAGDEFSIYQKYLIGENLHVVSITYRVNIILLFQRAFLYIFLIAGLLGIYVAIRTKSRQSEEGELSSGTPLPIRELRQFVTYYEEKNALLIDAEKANENLIRRKISKKEFNRLMTGINAKIKELEEEMRPFKITLVEYGGKLKDIIQQLDYLEAEKISIKDSLNLLQDRYKRGKLPSKAAFERLSDDLIKRMNKAQNKIDKNINELRAYLI